MAFHIEYTDTLKSNARASLNGKNLYQAEEYDTMDLKERAGEGLILGYAEIYEAPLMNIRSGSGELSSTWDGEAWTRVSTSA